jgi:hypothetical protein
LLPGLRDIDALPLPVRLLAGGTERGSDGRIERKTTVFRRKERKLTIGNQQLAPMPCAP